MKNKNQVFALMNPIIFAYFVEKSISNRSPLSENCALLEKKRSNLFTDYIYWKIITEIKDTLQTTKKGSHFMFDVSVSKKVSY